MSTFWKGSELVVSRQVQIKAEYSSGKYDLKQVVKPSVIKGQFNPLWHNILQIALNLNW